MKTLIIGSHGMLGQELVRAFVGHEIIAWDRADIDIANPDDVRAKILALQPQLIINAAAYNNVDECEKTLELALPINGYGPGYVAEAARAVNAVFVHYSTDYVFDGLKKEGYSETDSPDPVSAYGFTKRQGEKRALESGGRVYVIRTSRLFGKPAVSENAKKSFIDTMIGLAAVKPELAVVHEEYSSPTYVVDLAKHTRLLVEQQLPFGIYHIANSGACTWYEWAKEGFRIAGVTTPIRPVNSAAFPRPARRPAYSQLLSAKLPPLRSWQSAVQEYLLSKKG